MTLWYESKNPQIKKWQDFIEDRATKTFCVLPWIHLATRPNGDMRLCCSANASGAGTDHTLGIVKTDTGEHLNFSNTTPMEAWNSEYMRSVRTTMMDGKIPTSCTKCFDEESKGVASKRIWETATWFERGKIGRASWRERV
jgi:hypothetical protein